MNRRRTNKSAKVPNVKLRPAAPVERGSKNRNEAQATWLESMGVESEQEISSVDLCPRPFRGVVLCATGIEDKTTLFKQALELGALCIGDLTDKVTHLVAVESGSAKYRCALENKVPIMHPSWISDSYDIWLRGDDVGLNESVETHRLPVFSDVVLCLSGIDDIERRTEINRLVTKNGGKYVKNIERPVKVTHLVCGSSSDAQTEKMKYAEKFNKRGEADIRIVWEEWFWDSLDFGGRFNEGAYKVSNPRPQRKQPPEPATPPPPSSSPPLHSSQSLLAVERTTTDTADLLAAARADEEEVASVRRVPAEMLAIWGSLLKPRGFEVQGGRLVRSPSKSQAEMPPAVDESPNRAKTDRLGLGEEIAKLGKDGQPTSALALPSFRRAHSFAPVAKDKDASTSRQPFGRAPTLAPASSFLAHPSNSAARAGPSRLSTSVTADKGKGRATDEPAGDGGNSSTLFQGLKFRALGEAKGPSVRAAIEECGGRMVSEIDEDADYVIVRLVSGSAFYRQEGDKDERRKYRTECWLEQCIFDERICSPGEHVAFTPLDISIPVDGAERIVLSYSGLNQSEACWIRRLARALGIGLAPNFSRHSTHLLCPSRTGAKAEKAVEWGVPVVDMLWLAAIVKAGRVESLQNNEPGCRQSAGGTTEPIEMDVEMAPPKVDRKGKGKADLTMADITNGSATGDQAWNGPTDHEHHQAEQKDAGDDLVASDEGSFGRLNGLLDEHWRPPTTPPPGRKSTLARSSTVDSAASAHVLVKDSRAPSFADVAAPYPTQCVPSSESPSPLKHPDNGNHSTPGSPTKIAKEGRAVLQESITSLLGKRSSSEDENAAGKRARPPSKTKSRSFTKPPDADDSAAPDGFDPDVLATPDTFSLADAQAAGRSMRVTYEDPGQHAEKKKLVRLLASQKKEIWDIDGNNPAVRAGSPTATKPTKKGPAPRRKVVRAPGF